MNILAVTAPTGKRMGSIRFAARLPVFGGYNVTTQETIFRLGHDRGSWRRRDLLHRSLQMPWTWNDAERHTHKATTTALKELWAKVANESLERTGDEARAIREANAVIARQAGAS